MFWETKGKTIKARADRINLTLLEQWNLATFYQKQKEKLNHEEIWEQKKQKISRQIP